MTTPHIQPYWDEALADVALLIGGQPPRPIVYLTVVKR